MDLFRLFVLLLLAAILETCGVSAILPAVIGVDTSAIVLFVAFLPTLIGWCPCAGLSLMAAVIAVVSGKGLEREEKEDCRSESA